MKNVRLAAVASLAAFLKGSVLNNLAKMAARSFWRASDNLDRQLAPKTPFIPLFGWGRETKGPLPRHPRWPLRYTTAWLPQARHGAQERARRIRQIARGQLRRENGLAV